MTLEHLNKKYEILSEPLTLILCPYCGARLNLKPRLLVNKIEVGVLPETCCVCKHEINGSHKILEVCEVKKR